MSYYAADPPPSSIERETAEYLNRQFVAIGSALTPVGQLVAPTASEVPQASIPGAVLYVEGDGLYACLKTTAEGTATWIKVAPIEMTGPVMNLSGKTWNDFL